MPPPSKNPATTDFGLSVGKAKIGFSTTESSNKFPYGCKYCGRANKCSRAGNSCGQPSCNAKWKKEHSGVTGRLRQGAEFFTN